MEDEVQFGPFVLKAGRRTLSECGKNVALGSRAMDILICLSSKPGQLLTNAELIRYAWPDTFVDETNLRVHISALRRALGDMKHEPRFITNIPGRGYTFIAEVVRRQDAKEQPSPQTAPPAAPAVQRQDGRIVGRAEVLDQLARQLGRTRLLTIVGPGGIGKSTVARSLLGSVSSEVVWVDLAEISTGDLIWTEIASKLKILTRADDMQSEIAEALEGRELVIVLDSCEHVVNDAACLIEAILSRTTTVAFLATSREPLRADGEWVHRLKPLDLPEECSTSADALRSPAIQLFVERAAACRGGFDLDDDDVRHVLELCNRLDGIPLAIELAAARTDTMSLPVLSRCLRDSFRILSRGRRTALMRHQTLRATLDWSYLVLPPEEQTALQQLSVFRGWFAADAAAAILGDADDHVESLVSKSLVVAEAMPGFTRYRLLDTTRLYALEKLKERGQYVSVIGRLAEYLVEIFETNDHRHRSGSGEEWVEDLAPHVASLRLSLDWSFGSDGNPLGGVRLLVAALPLFYRLALLDECFGYVTRAIEFLDANPLLDERRRMKLHTALGWPHMQSGHGPPKGLAAWTEVLNIAERLGDVDYQLRGIWAIWVDAINRGEPSAGLKLAEKFGAVAETSADPLDAVVAKRMMGATLHWLGRHDTSRDLLERMIAEYDALPGGHTTRFHFDQRITARIILARDYWMLGDGEKALEEVRSSLDRAIEIGHELSLANLLAEAACPIALLEGRLDLARDYIELLKKHTKALSLDVWRSYACCFEAELKLRQGDARACLAELTASVAVLNRAGFSLFSTWFQAIEATSLAAIGRSRDALTTVQQAIDRCEVSGERWCRPELLRIKAQILLDEGNFHASALAGACLLEALDNARTDGAVAWQRSIACSLTRVSASSLSEDGIHGRH